MLIQKIIILLFSLILSLFPAYQQTVSFNKQTQTGPRKLNTSYTSNLNIDSLYSVVKNSGWNNLFLPQSAFYLVNNKLDFAEEYNRIGSLPGSFEKSFLYSLLLKRQYKFDAMFDTLYPALYRYPEFLPFYEELVFSASASNKLTFLESKIDTAKKSPQIKYLLSLISSSKGEYKKAVTLLNELVIKDSANADYLYHLSYAYRYIGDYESALKALKTAVRSAVEDDKFLAKEYLAEGSLYFLSDRYDYAERIYNKGLLTAKKIGDKQNEAKALVNLGIIKDINGDIDSARSYFKNAIAVSGEVNDIESLALAYSELGVSYTFTGELIEAKKNYLESSALYEKAGNILRLSFLLNNLGKIYMGMFDYHAALELYDKGMRLAGDNKKAKAINLIGIADVYANLSNYSKALHYYREARKISMEINELSLNAEIDAGLGALNFNLDRFSDALKYYAQAKDYGISSGDVYLTADLYHKIGVTYFRTDSLEIAKQYLDKSLEMAKQNGDPQTEILSAIDLADLFSRGKDFEKAMALINRAEKNAVESGFDYLLAKAKLIEGDIFNSKGDMANAAANYKEALQISKKLNEFNLQIDADYRLALIFEKNNFIEAAESYYQSTAALIEDVSRPLFEKEEVQISYYSAQRDVYNSFAEFYLSQKDYKNAFEMIDMSRSRNMIQNLNNLKLESLLADKKSLDRLYEYNWVIHSGIYTDVETDSVKRELTILKKELVNEQPILEKYLNLGKRMELADIQKSLGRGENILSLYVTDNNMYAFLINKNNFHTVVLNVTKKELAELISSISPYFEQGTASDRAFFNQDLFSFNTEAAYKLYEKIFKPLADKIPFNEKLIISPCPELISLPFEFLVTKFDKNESAFSYVNKDYLINHYSISYTPTASAYVHQKENNLKNDDKILVVGNPAINSNLYGFAERRGLLNEPTGVPRNISLLPLKYSEEEVNLVGSIVNADKILLDKDATESKFKQDSPLSKVIHLSTHSMLYNKQPVIFFSNYNDKENDGFLEASEIVQLKLNSDLVVLSSCNSGLGVVDELEGILGMTKAFFEAGTKSVVVSLWEVNDKYTSSLMKLYYEKLSDGYDKSEALRLAKIDFIKKYSPNPYFWAAFVLSGNTSSLEIESATDFTPLLIVLVLVSLGGFTVFYLRRKIWV
jgi:CHAT domain-containing protein/lipopolysaccharide biosynthesis regulator YciM